MVAVSGHVVLQHVVDVNGALAQQQLGDGRRTQVDVASIQQEYVVLPDLIPDVAEHASHVGRAATPSVVGLQVAVEVVGVQDGDRRRPVALEDHRQEDPGRDVDGVGLFDLEQLPLLEEAGRHVNVAAPDRYLNGEAELTSHASAQVLDPDDGANISSVVGSQFLKSSPPARGVQLGQFLGRELAGHGRRATERALGHIFDLVGKGHDGQSVRLGADVLHGASVGQLITRLSTGRIHVEGDVQLLPAVPDANRGPGVILCFLDQLHVPAVLHVVIAGVTRAAYACLPEAIPAAGHALDVVARVVGATGHAIGAQGGHGRAGIPAYGAPVCAIALVGHAGVVAHRVVEVTHGWPAWVTMLLCTRPIGVGVREGNRVLEGERRVAHLPTAG